MSDVLVVTLPLGANYGGILQAYALQTVVGRFGLTAHVTGSGGALPLRMVRTIPGSGYVIDALLERRLSRSVAIRRQTHPFIRQHIRTVNFNVAEANSKCRRYHKYLVGSDQVWRPEYTHVPHNLLSFAPSGATRLSYAASFGVDTLEGLDDSLANQCRTLAGQFDAISVREASGVRLCCAEWGVGAEQHLDPTMLLDSQAYINLFTLHSDSLTHVPIELLAYVLDPSPDSRALIDVASTTSGLTPRELLPAAGAAASNPVPTVYEWLRSFHSAAYVVTDSFHGVVFSIIFNKPFLVAANSARGSTRFDSLLGVFGLEDRLISGPGDVTPERISAPIDWAQVNTRMAQERHRAHSYLRQHLASA